MLLTALPPTLCFPSFFILRRDPCLGMVLAKMGWTLLHQLLIKKMPHSHAHMPAWSRQTLQLACFLISLGYVWSPLPKLRHLSITIPHILLMINGLFLFFPITLLMLRAFKILCSIFRYLTWNILLAKWQPLVVQTLRILLLAFFQI